MKKIKLLSVLAMSLLALAFTSCNTGDSNGFEWPSVQQTQAMFSQLPRYGQGGMLFPGSYNTSDANKFDKDSVALTCSFTSGDSTLIVRNVPVANFAKYISDETISKEVASLQPQDMKVLLCPYSYDQLMFITATYDITYTNAEGKKVQIQFYSGLTNYSVAYIGTKKTNNKKELAVYITPGRILVDGQTKTNALKSYVYQNYANPYSAMLEVEL